jgi:hypothetical protein
MRYLSFVQLAEDKKEIEFAVIQREMQLEEAEIEDFIIDGKNPSTLLHIQHVGRKYQGCDFSSLRKSSNLLNFGKNKTLDLI